MTATYTFDVFSSLDGFGSVSGGDWGGYWGKQGPELLDHRLASYSEEQRMVFGANTYRLFAQMLASNTEESGMRDPWVTRMLNLPATIVSTTLEGPLNGVDATVVSGDAVDVVARLKEQSEVPLRSHGSLSMNRALMGAGLVDRVQVTVFPVITGQNGSAPNLPGCGRLRPRVDRESNARRKHPRTRLPAHPAHLSPSTRPTTAPYGVPCLGNQRPQTTSPAEPSVVASPSFQNLTDSDSRQAVGDVLCSFQISRAVVIKRCFAMASRSCSSSATPWS
jgi:dihydrofolate reductase